MKLGVITDGISRDFAHALAVMDEFGLEYAESPCHNLRLKLTCRACVKGVCVAPHTCTYAQKVQKGRN